MNNKRKGRRDQCQREQKAKEYSTSWIPSQYDAERLNSKGVVEQMEEEEPSPF